ncbi:polysaccharide deacetylase family protein [Pseudomonas sp. UBA4194]|uniref:polysaccharide deacetylase family protein n=1 Tax=Pseudomonas sp. UBA4194 TaxID=1947317 RepID=UPI0025FC9A2E|nr:polysaccharide deacetylase family protein [Pseudomonas sp. UBA4194]
MDERHVMLVLHDVSPQTWPDYQPFVEAVDALGAIPMTFLVVPDFHHNNPLEHAPDFCRLLDQRVARGDELALHGYYHADDGPAPTNPRDYFMRRLYTWEGEFYTLDHTNAAERLEAGQRLFHRCGWPLHGFVAPAWLMSPGTRQALRESSLLYTSDPQHLYQLPDFSPVSVPGLVWSAGSAWRRGLSKVFSDWRESQLQAASCIRLGLHPVDMRHAYSRQYWFDTLQRLIRQGRRPVVKHLWLSQHASARSAA